MDGSRFDTLIRSLAVVGSRRRGLAAALVAALGTLGIDTTEARKKCPPCKGGTKGTCKKKRPDGTACPTGECQDGRCIAPTCFDGRKNGSETGIDCGGSCKRCANGQGCLTRNDCEGAYCAGGTCQACTVGQACGCSGASCACFSAPGGTICAQETEAASNCAACPHLSRRGSHWPSRRPRPLRRPHRRNW